MKDYLLHCVPVTSTLLDLLERDGRDEMVADVGADDIIEEIDIDEAEITVDGGGGSTPKSSVVVFFRDA